MSTGATPDAEFEDDYELVTIPCGRGCVSTTIKSLHFQRRTFLHILKERLFHNFPCACCDHRLFYYCNTCQHCLAPVCIECASFIKKYAMA